MMASTHTISEPLRNKSKAGFSLAELIVAMMVLSLALSAIVGSTMFVYKSTAKMGIISEMNNNGRFVMDQLGYDLRSTVQIDRAGKSRLRIYVDDPNGNQDRILYVYSKSSGTLYRRVNREKPEYLLLNLDDFAFTYFDSEDRETKNLIDVKKITVFMELEQKLLDQATTREYKSARFLMRNRLAG